MTDQELLLAIGQVVEAKLEPVRQDIRELHTKVDRLEGRMDRLEMKVDRLEERVDRLEMKVGRLEERMDRLETKVDHLEERMDRLETKVDHLEERMDRLEESVDDLKGRTADLEEKMTGVRVYIDTDLHRTLNLLMEGQQAVLDRVTPPEKYEELEIRTGALEMAVKHHSQEIRELKSA